MREKIETSVRQDFLDLLVKHQQPALLPKKKVLTKEERKAMMLPPTSKKI